MSPAKNGPLQPLLTIKKNGTVVNEETKSPLATKDDILSDDSGSDITRKDAHSSFMSDDQGQISPVKINQKSK